MAALNDFEFILLCNYGKTALVLSIFLRLAKHTSHAHGIDTSYLSPKKAK